MIANRFKQVLFEADGASDNDKNDNKVSYKDIRTFVQTKGWDNLNDDEQNVFGMFYRTGQGDAIDEEGFVSYTKNNQAVSYSHGTVCCALAGATVQNDGEGYYENAEFYGSDIDAAASKDGNASNMRIEDIDKLITDYNEANPA